MVERFWHDWSAGERVVLRYRLSDGSATDALGVILELDEASITVDTKRGPARVPVEAILLGKRVPPPPVRRTRSIR